MIRRPPSSTRTDTLFPYTTLFRSPFVHRAIHDIALVNVPRFGDREIDAEQRTPTPFAIFDGFRNDLERHPAETQRLVQRARGVRLGILMLILVGRRTVGEFRQIAFGDPETGLFGFVDHPDEGDLGQSAFLLGIAAADVRVDAGEPQLLDIMALPLFGPETQWPKRSEEHTSALQSLMRISYAL